MVDQSLAYYGPTAEVAENPKRNYPKLGFLKFLENPPDLTCVSIEGLNHLIMHTVITSLAPDLEIKGRVS